MIKIKSHHLLYESINGSDCPVCSLVYFGQCYETCTLVQSGRIVTSFWNWLSKTYGCTSMASGDSTRNLNLFRVLVRYSVTVYKGNGVGSVVSAMATWCDRT